MTWQQSLPYLVPLLVIALVARRAFRSQTPQRIRPERLWIRPVLVAVAMISVLATLRAPGVLGFALFAAATAVGVVVGYLNARHQEFFIDPETGYVMSKASPVAVVLFVGLFVVRYGLNFWMRGGAPQNFGEAPTHQSAQLMLYTDAMLFFAFAMVAASAWEVWRRTRPLVVEHRANRPVDIPQAPSGDL